MNLPDPTYGSNDFTILDKKISYKGYFRIETYRVKYRLFAGGWSGVFTREIFERGSAAGALLYDPHLDKVVLLEQFRMGALSDDESPWLLELVAGVIDRDGETVQQVVERESQEEAGLIPTEFIPICHYWVSPGGTSERTTLFCAKVDASQAGGIHGLDEEQEDIRVLTCDPKEAFAAVTAGRINNASTIIALQWLQLNYKEVRNMWLLEKK